MTIRRAIAASVRKDARFTVMLEPAELTLLRRFALTNDVSVGRVMRYAVSEFLSARRIAPDPAFALKDMQA